jgi:hypothetical protein
VFSDLVLAPTEEDDDAADAAAEENDDAVDAPAEEDDDAADASAEEDVAVGPFLRSLRSSSWSYSAEPAMVLKSNGLRA